MKPTILAVGGLCFSDVCRRYYTWFIGQAVQDPKTSEGVEKVNFEK